MNFGSHTHTAVDGSDFWQCAICQDLFLRVCKLATVHAELVTHTAKYKLLRVGWPTGTVVATAVSSMFIFVCMQLIMQCLSANWLKT